MKKMNYIWIYFLVFFQSVSTVLAQEVTTEGGYPVVDLSALAPLGATLTYAEAQSRLDEMNAQTVSNIAVVSPAGIAASGEKGIWIARVSAKYQVMRADLTYNGSVTMDWATAWAACKEYSGEDGSASTWRLPTLGELQMIWVLHPQLIRKGGFDAFISISNNYYWSSTESSNSNAWCVYFNGGYTYSSGGKTKISRVRCVSDLP